MTLYDKIKEEVKRTESEFSRAPKGTEERLTRGKELIKALNVQIDAIEKILQGTALMLDEDAVRRDEELRSSLRENQDRASEHKVEVVREDQDRARRRKLEVRREVGPQLIDRWLADESGYDEAAWPAVQQALDRDHTP